MPRISGPIPDHVRRLMPLDDVEVVKMKKSREKFDAKLEREMHKVFSNWLLLHKVPHVHAAMNKKATIRVGWPDYTLAFQNQVALIEMKLPGKKLSKEQVEVHALLANAGCEVAVCYSAQEAIVYTKARFRL